jgi:Ca2+-transporting ATPase
VLVFAVAVIVGLGAPLAVVQVLVVNLVTDGLPAVALARDPASAETMTSPPRRAERLFDCVGWVTLGAIGCLVGAVTLAAYAVGKAADPDAAQTMAFATLSLAELALVFTIRSPRTHAWRLPRNGGLLAGTLASAALLVALVYLPAAHEPFRTVALEPALAAIAAGLALTPFVLIELAKTIAGSRPAAHSPPKSDRVAAPGEAMRQ